MKKTLIAMAAIAAMGAASAEMTIYGKVDLGLTSSTSTAGPNQGVAVTSGNYSTSRFGFNGSTDLGGGLKGSFMMETGFDAANPGTSVDSDGKTNGATVFGNRGASAAISGSGGTVSLGNQFSPYSMASWNEPLEYDGFSTLYWAWQANGVHQEGFWHKKSVMYTSPTVGGFNASVMYANAADATATDSGSTFTSVGANYANGPMTIAFGQETTKAAVTGLATNAWQLSAAYAMGAATVYVGVEGATAAGGAVSDGKDTGWDLGANIGLGNGNAVQLGYGSEKSTAVGATLESTVTALSAVFVKEWNKATRIYAGVMTQDTTATTSVKTNMNITSVGVRYSF